MEASTGETGGTGEAEPSALLTLVEDLLKEGLRMILSLTLPKKDLLLDEDIAEELLGFGAISITELRRVRL